MHDHQLPNLCGWPDLVSASSVIRCVKQSVALAVPSGFTTTTWDAHVVMWPWMQSILGQTQARVNDVFTVVPTPSNALGGVQVFAASPTQPFDYLTSPTIGAINLSIEYTAGSGRILGAGIEVINTTSDLYRQGTTTVWRQEEAKGDDANMGYLAASVVPLQLRYANYRMFRAPPPDITSALLYPGTKQWRAADGAYLVQTFTTSENPPTFVGYVQPAKMINTLDDVETPNPVPVFNAGGLWVPRPYTVGTFANVNPAIRLHPLNMTGVYFTGLSPQTTLTMNVNIYYETFPSAAEKGILVLAKPSASYDPVALELMSRVNSSLAVGVPSSWNPEGEWFWEIVNDLVDAAPAIGGAFGPIGSMMGKTIKSGYDALTDRYTPEKNKERADARAARRKKDNEREAKAKTTAKQRSESRAARNVSFEAAPGVSAPRPKRSGRGRK